MNSGGSSSSGLLASSVIHSGNDDQTITLSIRDSSGSSQSLALTLASDSTAQLARSIDEALSYINAQIQASSSADVRKIVAVKDRDCASGGIESIRFLSSLNGFQVSVGDNAGDTGITTGQGSIAA